MLPVNRSFGNWRVSDCTRLSIGGVCFLLFLCLLCLGLSEGAFTGDDGRQTQRPYLHGVWR